jgi:hypothetical protein
MNRVSPFRKRCWTNSNMVRRLGSTAEGPHDYAYTDVPGRARIDTAARVVPQACAGVRALSGCNRCRRTEKPSRLPCHAGRCEGGGSFKHYLRAEEL